MPPFWQILLAIALATAFWFIINLLILCGMEKLVILTVHLTVAIYLCLKIVAVIGWVLNEIDP